MFPYLGTQPPTGASGFFFQRNERLHLVTKPKCLREPQSVHSGRLGMAGRSSRVGESLGLNCDWNTDILRILAGR